MKLNFILVTEFPFLHFIFTDFELTIWVSDLRDSTMYWLSATRDRSSDYPEINIQRMLFSGAWHYECSG